MDTLGIIVRIRAKPGKREDIRALWEQRLKPRAEDCDAIDVYFACNDDNDENVLLVFEHYTDREIFQQNVQSTWMAEWVVEVSPLLDGEPEASFGSPFWVKK